MSEYICDYTMYMNMVYCYLHLPIIYSYTYYIHLQVVPEILNLYRENVGLAPFIRRPLPPTTTGTTTAGATTYTGTPASATYVSKPTMNGRKVGSATTGSRTKYSSNTGTTTTPATAAVTRNRRTTTTRIKPTTTSTVLLVLGHHLKLKV